MESSTSELLFRDCIRKALKGLATNRRYLVIILTALRTGEQNLSEITLHCLNLGVTCTRIKEYLDKYVVKGLVIKTEEKYKLTEEGQYYADLLYDLLLDLRDLVERVISGSIDLNYIVSRTMTIPAMLITITSESSVNIYFRTIYSFVSLLQLEVFNMLTRISVEFRNIIKTIDKLLAGQGEK